MSTSKPLLVFDFDGVIVDGMPEYWSSSRNACLKLVGRNSNTAYLPEAVPETFRILRPYVHQGWEMVLLVAELIRPNSPLLLLGAKVFSENYQKNCKEALKAWNWEAKELQNTLENVRREAITKDRGSWLANHKAFPGVIQRLKQLEGEGYEFAVLTTKSSEFTEELLNHLQLSPSLLYGHEAGSKTDVLVRLSRTHVLRGFVEDRRTTLEIVLDNPELNFLPCYLASWGYLKKEDNKDLPPTIQLLNKKTFMAPLARWP